jgi:MFS family permease
VTGRPARSGAPGGWGAVGVLILAHALGTLNFTAVLAMAPRIQTALGLSRTEVGLLSTAYNAGLLAGALPAGWVVDRYGVRAGLVVAHLLMALATALLAGFGHTLAIAVPCLALTGLGYAVVNPATVKGVLLWLPVRLRATAMGLKQTGVPLGGLLAAGTAALAARVEWTTLLLAIAAATAAGAALCLRTPADGPGDPAAGRAMRLGDIGAVVRNRNLTVVNAAGGGFNMGQTSFTTYLTLFLRDALHAGLPFASACFGLAQAGSTAGRIAWGLVSDRLWRGRRKPVLVLLGVLAAAGFGALGALGPGGALVAAALAVALGLTVASYAGLLQAAAAEAVHPRLGGAAIGYNMVFTPLGGMLGPPLFGALVDRAGDYGPAWLAAGGVVLASSLVLARGFRERPLAAPAR